MRLLFTGFLLLAGCDDALAGVGQPCSSSGDCASGLLCDFSRKQHVCEPAGQVRQDLSVPEVMDMAGDDFSLSDLSTPHD